MLQIQRLTPQYRRPRASVSVMILKGLIRGIIAMGALLGLYSVLAAAVGLRGDAFPSLAFLIPIAGSVALILYARATLREVDSWQDSEPTPEALTGRQQAEG